jgi:ribosome-associated heat shock protein Hsp15
VNEAAEGCRIDVWLWRARFFKTRSLAARMVSEGHVKLARGGAETPIDKPSRAVRCGDGLIIVVGARQATLKIEALGTRRGPAPEARALYSMAEGWTPTEADFPWG